MQYPVLFISLSLLLLGGSACKSLVPKRSHTVQLSAEQANTRVQVDGGEAVELPVLLDVHTFTESVTLTYLRRQDTLQLVLKGRPGGRVGRNEYNRFAPVNRQLYRYPANYHLDWKTRSVRQLDALSGGVRFSVRLLNTQVGFFNTLNEEAYFGFGFVRPGVDVQLSPQHGLNVSFGYGKDYCRRTSFGTVGMRNYVHQYVAALYQFRMRSGRIGGGLNYRNFELGRNNQGFDFNCERVRYTNSNTPFLPVSNRAIGLTFSYEYDLGNTTSIYTEFSPDIILFDGNVAPGRLSWLQIGLHYRSPAFRVGR